ncbi:Zinc finger, C2H2, LYAR-type [Penicillium griseofulvum]|uniref:Zinc finger, C2H2, LYAR-type n=1 Tax=Penicillium patulum TaxID=5078 RepID=A0A135LEC8_PENPA|nr:Zinc finger, C2H2, LYAR-type [Penicillium griseofulvum]KXG47250.1 Zinc finger, C2H2, LYAR-type [Penicillium griseofulvum]
MVSFSCEACGDVLTKKKLDPHRGQCRGASFTCIDCMVHFYGFEYRAHTSCMSEAQKYQGALYKEKPQKNKKGQNNQKQNANQTPNGRHQQARVEDAPPPPAPTPPPAGEVKAIAPAPANNDKAVNVFDYLVADETPNASKVAIAAPKEQMMMNPNAKSLFEPSQSLTRVETNPNTDDEGKNYDVAYEENGFSYGAGQIPHSDSPPNASTTEFVTPAPKKKKERREKAPGTVSEKKRKRGQAEVLSTPREDDTNMMDAPSSIINNAGTPMLNHSGLTGGLSRMMRSASPDGDDSPETSRRAYQDTSSPIKRSRRNGKEANGNGDPGLGISMKNRAGRLVSSMFGGSAVSSTNGSHTEHGSKAVARRGSSSSGDGHLEVRKSKKSHRSRDDHDESRKSKRKSSNPTDGDRPSRRLKQIDERHGSVDSSHGHQVTVYKQSRPPARTDEDLQRELAYHFLSMIPNESERGFSVNKALKRFHRDLSNEYDGHDDVQRRADDEKDLFRALRLRRNDRGEIVVFI